MAKKTKKAVKYHDEEEEECYAAEEQGILPEESEEEIKEEMETGKREKDVYSKEGREELEEEDEIEEWEEGFMEGAEGGGQLGKDALTGEPLPDDDDEIVELRLQGKLYRFVSEENAKKFKKKQSK